MKTIYQNKVKAAVIALLSLTVLTMVACKKSGRGSATTVANTYAVGCSNCFTSSMLLLDGVYTKSYGDIVEMTFDLLGDASGYVQGPNGTVVPGTGIYDQLDAKAFLRYSGKALIHGYMNINDYNIGTCNAPIGEYYFKPVVTGNYQNGILTSSKMEAVNGATRIVFNIVSATFYSRTGNPSDMYTGSGQNGAGLNITVESVNGQACGYAQVGFATY